MASKPRPEENRDIKPIRVKLMDHLGLGVTGFLLFLVVVRLWTVSRYNMTTFLVLLQTSSPFSTIVGSLAPSFPAVTWAGLLLLGIWAKTEWKTWGLMAFSWLVILGTVFLLGTSLVLLLALTLATLVGGGLTWPMALRQRKKGRRWVVIAAEIVALGLAGGLLFSAFTIQDVWIPAQEVTIQGKKPVTGYVLQQNEQAITVLIEQDRRVVREDPSEIRLGPFCEVRGIGRALTQIIGASVRYPKCPS